MFKDGDKIIYSTGLIDKLGKEVINSGIIRGIAIVDLPVLGKTYIVENTDGYFPNEMYPFKFGICTENRIKLDE